MRTLSLRLGRIALGLLLAGPMGPACAAAAFNAPADVQAITAIETALATQTDMRKLIGFYAPNAIVFDIAAPGIYRGRGQIEAAFSRQLANVRAMKAKLLELDIASDGRFACAASRLRFDMTLRSGKLAVSTRQLDGLEKIHGAWQIVQEHASVPADPTTGMAVMDAARPPAAPLAWSADPLPGPATSPAQARDEIHRWMLNGAVSVGIDRLMTYYGPGDDVLVFDDESPDELRGLRQIRAYYTPLMSSFTATAVQIPLFSAASDGLFGLQIDTQNIRLTMRNGAITTLSLRQNDCLRRTATGWKSFFEMISFPADPNTGRAIMATPARSR